jgi:chromosomal replication initiator protein
MNHEGLWGQVLAELELQISRPNFLTWLKKSFLISIVQGEATVALPNYFAKEWVEAKYNKLVFGLLREKDPSIKKINYVVDAGLFNQKKEDILASPLPEKQLSFAETRIDPESGLNPRYTLRSFVVGSSNELAYAASQAVVECIGKKYNPLFLYGGTGLGKTHLIQAIGNEIRNRHKDRIRVKYVSSEKFTNDVIWAIRNKRIEDVKKNYRGIDVLIIDDIQFIGGKEKTEEEFFHTFNALHENNKQIIISSDRPPRAIPILEERLRSRFEGGMIADISQPDFETRMAILKVKIQEMAESVPDEIVSLTARLVQRNIRELEGALNRIIFQARQKGAFDLGQAEKLLAEMANRDNLNVTPAQIIKAVASFYEIAPTDLLGRSRKKEVVEPRQIAIYLLRDMLDMSYPYIAEKMGKRDHTTAIYAYEKISQVLEKNSVFQQKLVMIKELVGKPDSRMG